MEGAQEPVSYLYESAQGHQTLEPQEEQVGFSLFRTLVDKVTEVRVEIEKALRRFHMDYMHFVEGGYEFGDEIDQETQKGRNCKIRSNALVVMQKYLITNFHNPYPHSQAKMELAA